MILFLYGKDTYRSRQQLHKMVEKFKADRDPSGMNARRFDCLESGISAGTVMSEILAAPFLAEKRLVVVENLLTSKLTDLREMMLEKIQNTTLPQSTVVLLWEATDSFKTKDAKGLFELLCKEKYCYPFDVLSGKALFDWIVEEVKHTGAAMAQPAVSYVAEHIGGDTWQMHSLLEQVSAYAHGREITIADVRLFVEEKANDDIFALVDAISSRQPKHVFAMMREQYRNGKDAGYVFAMVLRQCRILLQIRDLFERQDGVTSEAIAKALGVHPFVAKKSLPVAKRYTLAELQKIYDQLLAIDAAVKTGGGEQELLLDLFVGKMTGVGV